MSNNNIGMPAKVAALIFTALSSPHAAEGRRWGGGGQPTASLVVTSTPIRLRNHVGSCSDRPDQHLHLGGPEFHHPVLHCGQVRDNGIATISGTGDGSAAITRFNSNRRRCSEWVPTRTPLQLQGCYDKACTQQVQNSPQTVSVTYSVTESPPSLISLSPSAVNAGGGASSSRSWAPAFLRIGGAWNGSARPTNCNIDRIDRVHRRVRHRDRRSVPVSGRAAPRRPR